MKKPTSERHGVSPSFPFILPPQAVQKRETYTGC